MLLLVPTFILLTFHWYEGVVTPLVGVAVKVTEAPEQIGLADGAILTLTGRFVLTIIVIVLDVAGLPVAHVALEVRMHVTRSPFARAELVYVLLFVPTFPPLSFHW